MGCSCSVNQEQEINVNFDPTRTLTLRNQFAREMSKRFSGLRGIIRKAVVEEDVFGLSNLTTQEFTTPGNRAFANLSDGEKVTAFMDWVKEQEQENILEAQQQRPSRLIFAPLLILFLWTDRFIREGYKRGVSSARSEMRKVGHRIPSIDESGGIDNVVNEPTHRNKVDLLNTRFNNDFNAVVDSMNGNVSRVLSESLSIKDNKETLASKITKTISGPLAALGLTRIIGNIMPGERRSKVLARTEIVRAHAEGTLQEFENFGIAEVSAQLEFRSARDRRVCLRCLALEEKRFFTLSEARGVIPVHAGCVTVETSIIAPKQISGFIASYTGTIVKLTFADGARLSMTPNHMLLSPHGFVFAKSLREGDDVFYCPDFKRVIPIDPNDNRNPSRIDNVIKSFSECSSVNAMSVPASSKDFHGDGKFCQGNVNIVGTNSFLGDSSDSFTREQLDAFKLDPGRVFDRLLINGFFASLLKRMAFASDSSMGRFRETLATINSLSLHPDDVSLAHGSECDSVIDQSIIDKPTTDIVSLREQANAIPGVVGTNKVVNVEVLHNKSLKVYDVQTDSSLYIANGILSSNCRCRWLPAPPKRSR